MLVWTFCPAIYSWGRSVVETINQSKFVADLAELFVSCKSAADYCRSIVMDPVIGKGAVGSQLFTVSQDGNLVNISNFGKVAFPASKSLSIWDDNLISRSVRENIEVRGQIEVPESKETLYIFGYPYRSPSHPVGIVVMVKTEDWAVVLPDEEQRTLSLMGALWLETLGVNSSANVGRASNADPDSLTPRQLNILQRMAEGKTNAEIAAELILSESSIRQETVRIYRALGVSSRQEAAKRGIHQGLITRVAV